LEDRIDADLALGRHPVVVSELEALCSSHPLRERLRGQLMIALYGSGRQAEALEAYQAFRQMLDDELGIGPSQELRDLERRMLQQDPSLASRNSASLPAHRSDGDRPAPTGIVGRERELDHLARAFEVAADGTRRLAFVSGEPGAGKTTLVEAYLAGLGEIAIGRGQCVESRGSGEAYMPVLEAIGRLCRTDAGDRLAALLRERAPTWLVQLPWLVAEEERAVLEMRVLGVTRDRMLREIMEALEAFTADEPAVLVLEDLHWADVSTIDFLDVLARRFEPARLLVVGTFRPTEARAAGHPLAGLVSSLRLANLCTETALGSLPEPAARAYLAVRLDGTDLGAEVAEALHGRTRGNPLFMEKLVDAWIEDGALSQADGTWRLARELETLTKDVPATLRSLIEQRASTLDAGARALLEAASVAGAEFASATAAAAAAVDEDDAERTLRQIASEATFVDSVGDVHWPDGTVSTTYRFTHDLSYETLQQGLPTGQRARIHRRIGDRLESAYGPRTDEIAVELAWHFLEGREPARAVRHLHAAAGRALELSAPREALTHLAAAREALPAVSDETERIGLELGIQQLLGGAMIATEGWSSPDAESALVRAKELARELADQAHLASALHGLATVYEIRGEYDRSEALLVESLALPALEELPGAVVDSNELMACSLFHQGSFSRSLAHAETAMSHYDGVYSNRATAAFGEHPDVSCQLWAALSSWFLGRPDQAMERAERAVAASTLGARSRARAVAQAQAAVVAHLRGDIEGAEQWSAAAIDAGVELGFTYWLAMARVLHGWARAAAGDPEQGLTELRAGIAASRGLGARMDDGFYLALLADAAARNGLREIALEALDEAAAAVDSRSFFFASELRRMRGELTDADEGERVLREALAIADELDSPSLRLRAATSLARRTHAIDDAAAVADVLALFDEGHDSADLVAARSVLDELGVDAAPRRPAPREARPAVRYARSGDLSIAYQVTGSAAPDVLLVPGFVSHLEKDWDEPRHAAFLDRLGTFSRLIRFDKRGTGLSDRPAGLPDLEARMDDVRSVQDAVGSDKAILFGYSEGGPLSILYAATHPERVQALVLFGAFVKRSDLDDDYPWAPTVEDRQAYIESLTEDWGFEADMKIMCPSADDAMARWWGERSRAAASPGAVRALMVMNSSIDVRDVLPAIHVPTLVVHRGTDFLVHIEEARYIARRIPGAQLVEIPGRDHFVAIDPDQILDVVEPFVREGAAVEAIDGPSDERVLTTVMVTDIVDSTPTVARLGDRRWSDLLARHHELVRGLLARHRGEEVDVAGDGVLAVFDGPARAIRCARAVGTQLEAIGLSVRIGLHTGEVERSGTAVRGIAVHLTSRIAAVAAPGEVLVSATTRDLVAGSGLEFADRGEHALKGISEPRRLFALAG
jgi:class 3 adenylate cyclase/alpha-beta hydrolase superfamily lysophospholipase/tetratricopeptide (TPR) repeat protein